MPSKTASLKDLFKTFGPGDLGPTVVSERTIMDNPNNSLKSDIGEELDWDPMLDDSQIVVNVQDGRVTLSGAVPTYYEVNLAEQDARSVRGVKAVDNDLLVGPIGESIADADLASRCAAALDADRFVPNGSISVGSWKEEEEAVDTAWGAPGVTDVVDRLIIVS